MSYKLIKKYQTQYEEFCDITDFNLEEITKRVPAEKHFWVCRLIDAKIEKDSLYKSKIDIKNALQKKIKAESPVALNSRMLDDLNSPSLSVINQKIKEHEFLVEYLERLVSQITFIGNDIKNIISIKTLQEN